jgi:hypothetical protein
MFQKAVIEYQLAVIRLLLGLGDYRESNAGKSYQFFREHSRKMFSATFLNKSYYKPLFEPFT